MNKEEVFKRRKVSWFQKVKDSIRLLFYGWQTRHIWDMPKKQRCPQCGGWKPRGNKLIGAEYYCNKDKKSFVTWKRVIIK